MNENMGGGGNNNFMSATEIQAYEIIDFVA